MRHHDDDFNRTAPPDLNEDGETADSEFPD